MRSATYEFVRVIQSGSYGCVLEVTRDGESFAIKQFKMACDKSRLIGAVYLNEADFLKRCDHPNILKLINVSYGLPYHCANGVINPVRFTPDNIFLIMPLAQESLYEFIRSNEATVPLLKRFMVQLVSVTHYLHTRKIGYRDFKSSNILIFKDRDHPEAYNAVLCDLGMAKRYTDGILNSDHVGTLSYKAPELLLGRRSYGEAVDIWGLGVVFFEMFNKFYPFDRQKDSTDDDRSAHSEVIVKLFQNRGSPSRDVFNKLTAGGNTIFSIEKLRKFSPKPISALFDENSTHMMAFESDSAELPNFGSKADYTDLLEKMLCVDPDERITIGEVAKHPFFSLVPKNDDKVNDDMWRDLRLKLDEPEPYHILIKTKEEERRKIGREMFNKVGKDFHPSMYRFLYQGIDIFERCMLFIEGKPKYDQLDIELMACTCMYIATKLFLNDDTPHWHVIFPSVSYDRSRIISMEQTIIMEFLDWKIYRTTIYDLIKHKNKKPKALMEILFDKPIYGSVTNSRIDRIAEVFDRTVK